MHITRCIGTVVAGLLVSAATFSATSFSATVVAAADQKPNILVFYLDDMGWAEPACYGGKRAPTPHIDAMAAAGARCTNGYVSACVCSPSRVGLMTGRYQARSGHDANPGKASNGLVLSETLMSQRLKDLGYATGIVGKWHLGSFEPAYLPIHRGFDDSIGSIANLGEGAPPYFYRGAETMDDFPGAPITTPVYASEACKFIESRKDGPWFLYLPFNAVHGPVVASKEALDRFAQLDGREQDYAAMISEVDDAIGKVMNKLRELQLEENTLVFLISDNGGASPLATMGGLRGRKWLVWEGGIRVSWLAQWKGASPPDKLSTSRSSSSMFCPPRWQRPAPRSSPSGSSTASTFSRCSNARSANFRRASCTFVSEFNTRCVKVIGSWSRPTLT